MTVGERIERKRKEKGLTMETLGELLGVGRSAINKWEKGYVQNISRSNIKKMAKIFECDPAWLGGYKDEESPEVLFWKNNDSGSLTNDTYEIITEAERLILFKIRKVFSAEELSDPLFIEELSKLLELAKKSGTDRLLALLDFANRTVS